MIGIVFAIVMEIVIEIVMKILRRAYIFAIGRKLKITLDESNCGLLSLWHNQNCIAHRAFARCVRGFVHDRAVHDHCC